MALCRLRSPNRKIYDRHLGEGKIASKLALNQKRLAAGKDTEWATKSFGLFYLQKCPGQFLSGAAVV